MGGLFKFAQERVKSLVSKKVGATVSAEVAVAATNPSLTGIPSIVYVIVQGLLDGWKYYCDTVAAKSE